MKPGRGFRSQQHSPCLCQLRLIHPDSFNIHLAFSSNTPACLIRRATRRLDELMGELERAALAVGDSTLAQKIDESRSTIRRDIMFAASLYI